MKPQFQSELLNGPFEDPVLFVDFLFEKRALLFDIGNIRGLATRKILRVTDVFVTHTHMDHFNDLDWLLRICLGREKRVRLYGPQGFIDRIQHKLGSYTWNLVHNYETDLTFEVLEVHAPDRALSASFHCQRGFRREDVGTRSLTDGVLLDDAGIRVKAAVLDHDIPCLGYALEEERHVNVWKNRLQDLGLPVGPWLHELKRAVLTDQPDDAAFSAWWMEEGKRHERRFALGELKAQVLRIVPGRKLAYVVDVAYTEGNRSAITNLAADADVLYIEATFLQENADAAAGKHHLTAWQAGDLGRCAGVRELVPMHFSPRYSEREGELRREAQAAFRGNQPVSEV